VKGEWSDMSRGEAYKLIGDAIVLENVAILETSLMPSRKAYCRALKLAGSPHRQRKVWRAVVKKVEASEKLNAKLIEATIREICSKPLRQPGTLPAAVMAIRAATKKVFSIDIDDVHMFQQEALMAEIEVLREALSAIAEYPVKGEYPEWFLREAKKMKHPWVEQYEAMTAEEIADRKSRAKELTKRLENRFGMPPKVWAFCAEVRARKEREAMERFYEPLFPEGMGWLLD